MGRPSRVSTPTTKIFAERLSDLVQMQKEKGLSHDEISKQIGVSSGVLSEWMSDNKTASIENLAKLAKYFSVTSDYLLGLSRSDKQEFHDFAETTHFSRTTMSILSMQSGFGRDNMTAQRRRIPFEHLLATKEFSEILVLLQDYLDTMAAVWPQNDDQLIRLYCELDSRICKDSQGNLHVVSSGLFSEGLLAKAQSQLRAAFEKVKANIDGPVLIHVQTKKGHGYLPAENNPSKFHGIGKFDVLTGLPIASNSIVPTYTAVLVEH